MFEHRPIGRRYTGKEFAVRLWLLNRSSVVDFDAQGRRVSP